jgi:tyrosine-protein phosphatase non-receptor type 4
MVWEQKCPLVVMVTPLEEKGRKKCHKYWPEADDELSVFGALRVRLVFQSDDSATTERHFRLCDQKVCFRAVCVSFVSLSRPLVDFGGATRASPPVPGLARPRSARQTQRLPRTHFRCSPPPDGIPGPPVRRALQVRPVRRLPPTPLSLPLSANPNPSAGIGRTGVLILMETALCLMEASEAIHALDLVREMREQRAMLIQTSAQFRFVSYIICREI